MVRRVLLLQGDKVWAEDPAYPGLTAVLNDLDLRTHRVAGNAAAIDAGVSTVGNRSMFSVSGACRPQHRSPHGYQGQARTGSLSGPAVCRVRSSWNKRR
jgi:GntR family transcriptional regulator / MocR family aminotransferase